MLFQGATCRLVTFQTLLLLQLWEELEDFVALAVADPLERVIARLEAFGPCTVAQHHFVAVEHEVNVGFAHHINGMDTFCANKVLGCGQNFTLFEVELCFV